MNKGDIAKAFGVTLTCIDGWLVKGMPFTTKGSKGRSYTFDLPDVLKWHKSHFLKDDGTVDGGEIPAIGLSRAKYEHYRAISEQLETEEKAGTLVNVEEVRKELFDSLRGIRDSILNISPRVSAIVAAELGMPDKAFKVNKIIEKEIHDVLSDMANIKLNIKGVAIS